ncbi:transcription factor S-II-related protein [Tupanvirus deep ocean]|uniref:Transcription factor S-II-related protein n=2 Tax=Tupanvirus TaxID=2094720 RepID=A0AC62A7U4_9VIRU|nr:transcription factor S-II-related protein [Tupanvirus deep ocean]QKU33862.1 transcription factor S-II-related protein [Tupanvirus deep ocean]
MTTVVEFYVPEKERKVTVKLLSDYFDIKHCPKIEKGLFNFSEQYCKSNGNSLSMAQAIYKDCVKNILFNCEQNNQTIQKIKKLIDKKKFNPYNLAFMKPEELDEDNWVKIILRKNTTEDKLKNLPTIEWYPCRVCKNTGHFYRQLQTRSADEPMTTFYICKQCGKTTRINN